MHKILACLLTFLLLTSSLATSTFAHSQFSFPDVSDGQINEAQQRLVPLRFLPSHPLYFLILTKETLQRFLQSSAANRAGFDLVLSGKRVKEAYQLATSGDFKGASEALDAYGKRLNKLVFQFEKARSQNQEVVPLADRIAEGLKDHEVLLSVIYASWQEQEDAYDFDSNFSDAVSAFSKTAMTINNVKPGLADRFRLIEDSDNDVIPPYASPPVVEATPSVKPKRIIF